MASHNDNGHDDKGLAKKLDRELDEHIDTVLEKNKNYKYEDVLTMDNLEEECKKIPMFSNEAPTTQEEIDASPQWKALQALKYESEDPHECATAHKEDGNHHFGLKEYRKAILAYTEGLRSKHDDSLLHAVLYTNRAAANFHLGNNRSALNDATSALKYKPDHSKALFRCSICCFDLEKYDDCIDWCDRGLKLDSNDKKLLDLKKKAAYQKKQQERDKRKREMKKLKDLTKRNNLATALKTRNIKLMTADGKSKLRVDDLLMENNSIGHAHSGKVYLDEKEALHWPLYFLYPEYNQSDFIEDVHENSTFLDHLAVAFTASPEWDIGNSYILDNIEIYFKDQIHEKAVHIDPNLTFKEVLSDSRYIVYGGCPAFLIFSKKTTFYKEMLSTQDSEEFK